MVAGHISVETIRDPLFHTHIFHTNLDHITQACLSSIGFDNISSATDIRRSLFNLSSILLGFGEL